MGEPGTRPITDTVPVTAPLPGSDPPSVERRYLDLLKSALLNEPGLEAEAAFYLAREAQVAGTPFTEAVAYDIPRHAPELLARVQGARTNGRFLDDDLRRPGFSYTMVGRHRLDELDACLATVLADDVPGDLVECGVWRGGASIFLRGALAAYGVTDRTVWACDSFAGLPAPGSEHDIQDLSPDVAPELAVSQDRVASHFEAFGLLDDQVRFVEGYFENTMPDLEVGTIALLRLDGDYYSSTMTVLDALYDSVAPGGFIVVDDYGLSYCRQAVDEFRAARGVTAPIEQVDWTGAHWRKEA
ncbi:MAG: glycosyl transferase, family 2/macrocin-O-methyltransferase family protein [Solirubrobacterales bacterium]|nr:glycosyl transferase, family 2/macrocin-O-methyltransferase family protein [Solirubrobacterales bacterium]